MPAPIHFGTDGWRAVIADQFTFENVRRVAQALADAWHGAGARHKSAHHPLHHRTCVIGYDCRFMSDTAARLVAEVMAGNGIASLFAHAPTPTPAVSWAIRDRGLCGGVVITASHNPPRFNGLKIKADYAGPAGPALTHEVEGLIDHSPVRSLPFEQGARDGWIKVENLVDRYKAALQRFT